MAVDQDGETLLDALYAHQQETGKRPSLVQAQMKFLPEWDKDRLLKSAQALEKAGDIVNVTPRGVFNVDLSSTARQRAAARTAAASTTFNIGSMSNSPLQNIGAGGQGTQNTQYQATADELRAVVDVYRQHADELGLDPALRRRADSQVATIEAQLLDKPDPTIVNAAGRSLKTIVEGAIAGTVANVVTNPGVWTGLLSLFS